MSDLELKRKERLTRAEAAKRLSAFAEALAGDGEIELHLGDTSLSLRVADDVRAEVEVEVDGDEIEVEVELKWSTTDGRAGAGSPEQGAEAPEHPTAKRSRRG